jgi:hypothetical protein
MKVGLLSVVLYVLRGGLPIKKPRTSCWTEFEGNSYLYTVNRLYLTVEIIELVYLSLHFLFWFALLFV